MNTPHLQDLAADLARLVLRWAPTHEPTHDLLRRALAQADPHGRAYRVSAASPDGLAIERLGAGSADTWLLRAGEGGLDVLRVRGDRLEVAPFSELWSEP